MEEQPNEHPNKQSDITRERKTKKEKKEKANLNSTLAILVTAGIFLSIAVGITSILFKSDKTKTSLKINTSSIKVGKPLLTERGVGLIEVYGVISYEKRASNILETEALSVAEKFVEDFKFMVNNNNVYAIVVSIDSPGGSLVACEETLKELKRLKSSTEKPVIVSFRSMAASGGYYLAMIGDEIFANESTLTGSIGVISQFMNFTQAMDKLGIKTYSITSGKNKDSFSPFREPREDEIAYWKGITSEMVLQFINVVEIGRKDKLKQDRNILFDGRVFSGKMALEYGLIDNIGTLNEAIRYASKKAGKDVQEPNIIKNEKQNQNPIYMLLNSMSGISNIKVSYYEDILKSKYVGEPMYLYIPAM